MNYKFMIILSTAVALTILILSSVVIQVLTLETTALSCSAIVNQAIGLGIDSQDVTTIAPVFIPWHNTHSLSKGIEALNRMYNSLGERDPLKLFLDTHCKHLLKPLEGFTNISTELSKPEVLVKQPNTVKLEAIYTPSQFEDLPGTVGIYVFYLEGDKQVAQCGSSTNFSNRMRNHYRDGDKGVAIFKTNNHDDFYWTPVAYSKDYAALFNDLYSMSPAQEKILASYTEQEVRSLEQAFATYANPTNYTGKPVSTTHNKWQEGDTHNRSDGKRTTWITEDGKLYSRWSMSASVTELGHTLSNLKKVAASSNPYLNTVKYGNVKLMIENVPMSEGPYDERYGTPLNTAVDKTALQVDKYYLYSKDDVQLPYGPFDTIKEVNAAMGVPASYSGVYLWYNYRHLLDATGLGIKVYVVKGISTTKIPILVENLKTSDVEPYKSITSALKTVWPKNRGGYNILKAMVTNTPIKTPTGEYLFTFQHKEHLEVSIKNYNAHKQTKEQDKINNSILPFHYL